ncbi:MAG: hypothetical protein FD149_2652 [Rhodospirillaceae bacterium]|nr:MAG: hypothetical protein FD149_2652 [Rhodospirillaceae bacterium]
MLRITMGDIISNKQLLAWSGFEFIIAFTLHYAFAGSSCGGSMLTIYQFSAMGC